MRGGEKVLEALCRALSRTRPLHTLVHVRGSVSPPHRAAPDRHVVRAVAARRRRGTTVSTCRSSRPRSSSSTSIDYDLVISTQPLRGQVGRACPGAPRTSATATRRCATPGISSTRISGRRRSAPRRSRLLRPVLARLARWDAATAGRVDRFVANSQYVAGRIRRYYNRGSTVVYPPVDTAFYRPDPGRSPEPFFLVVSALVPYKRLDVAIRACASVGAPLTIVGHGPGRSPAARGWRQRPGRRSSFSGWLDDDEDSRRSTSAPARC